MATWDRKNNEGNRRKSLKEILVKSRLQWFSPAFPKLASCKPICGGSQKVFEM
jgi:hypothetical protein